MWIHLLCIGITLTIFISLGNTPVKNDILIIYASGTIIKSGIKVNNLNGILEGPVDLFSRVQSQVSPDWKCEQV